MLFKIILPQLPFLQSIKIDAPRVNFAGHQQARWLVTNNPVTSRGFVIHQTCVAAVCRQIRSIFGINFAKHSRRQSKNGGERQATLKQSFCQLAAAHPTW